MIPFHLLLQHSLYYGALLSIGLSAIILVSLRYWPMVWIHDAPAEVRAVARPLTEAERRVRWVVTVLFFGWMAVILVASLAALRALSGGSPSFIDTALSTFIIFMTFNLVDLLLLDWLLVETMRPSFLAFPGVDQPAAFGGYTYHFIGFLKGTLGGAVFSLVVAALVVLIF